MRWVLVDVSWLAYRALHAVGDLEHEDVPTGVMFGFFTQLRQICHDERVQSNRVLIFCDSRSSFRRDVYPEYKAKRHANRDEDMQKRVYAMRDQMNLLTGKILGKVGFPVYHQEGLESDDLMARAARTLTKRRERAVMITSDGDLYQCITRYVHWYDPQRRVYHTPESFLMQELVTPEQWRQVKTLGGCATDNVKGVPGVGKITAVKYVLGKLPPTSAAMTSILSPKGLRVARRNAKLVVLPHKATGPVEIREPSYDPSEFFRFCKRYGLTTFLRDKEAWRSFFGAGRFKVRMRGAK